MNPRSVLKYDQGGMLMPGQMGVNLGRKPERVLSGRQTEILERNLNTAAGPVTVEVHFQDERLRGLIDVRVKENNAAEARRASYGRR